MSENPGATVHSMKPIDPREHEPVSLAPDPVIEAYKKDVDRTLIRENLQRSVEERFLQLMELARFAGELRRAGRAGSGAP